MRALGRRVAPAVVEPAAPLDVAEQYDAEEVAGGERGIRAVEHHSESKEAFWAHIPGLKVIVVSGPRNARALLHAAINDPDPVIFLEPKALYRAFREEVPEEPETMEIGQARVVREGSDVTLISYGATMRATLLLSP